MDQLMCTNIKLKYHLLKAEKCSLVLPARLSSGRRESVQIPIRLLCCILSSRVPNEVAVNISWDLF